MANASESFQNDPKFLITSLKSTELNKGTSILFYRIPIAKKKVIN